jgi:formate dehydrogenase iron-sulfur subunit
MIGILADVTKCIGCYQCVEACAEAHQMVEERPLPQHSPDGLSARRWATILAQPEGRYVRKSCFHCLDPACVSACPVGAMAKTSEGPVIYDPSLCMGCRYCMMACPYGIPRYEWDRTVPYVRKCTLCYERLHAGKVPVCVEACSEGAIVFGNRDELLAEAHRQIRAEPEKYIQKVYGEHEVGGTSVLYVSDIPLDFLGLRGDPGQEPLPDLTRVWIERVPGIGIGVTALTAGTFWIIRRRMQMETARVEAEIASPAEAPAEDSG